ncbi:MAG: hypothetical protein IJY72_03760 [Akkermansia sp.]|nr:hypothetical protein [Akkermansia sp.]
MKNPIARLYNFHGRLSRRDFLVYWLWVYLLPKIWFPLAGGGISYLIFGTEVGNTGIAWSVIGSVLIHLLLISFFLGAIWRRLNDIGFALYPKLLIFALMFFFPPYGWILQLIMLLLPRRQR